MASDVTIKARAVSPASNSSPNGLTPLDIPVDRFAGDLARREANHRALLARLKGSLVAGVDYTEVWQPADNRWSKPSLRKPGAEKICGMLGLRARFPDLVRYEEAARSGASIRQIFLRCQLETLSGFVAAEGSGARSIWQDEGDLDRSVQLAEESAQIDATLRVAGLSGVFTRELEGTSLNGSALTPGPPSTRRPGYPVEGPGPITAKQAKLIMRLLRSRWFSFEEREAARVFCSRGQTTKEQGSRFVVRIKVLLADRSRGREVPVEKPAPVVPRVEDVSSLSAGQIRRLRKKGEMVCWRCKARHFIGVTDAARVAGWTTYVYRKRSFWACPGCLAPAEKGAGEVLISEPEFHALKLRGKVVCGGCRSKWFQVPGLSRAYVGAREGEEPERVAARETGWIVWNDGVGGSPVDLCPVCAEKPQYEDKP